MDSKRMAKEWGPSWVGQHVTGSSDWRLRLEGLELALALNGRTHWVNVEDEATYRVNAGIFWTDITFHPGQGREVKADGLPNTQGAVLVQALDVALTEKRLGEDLAFLQGEQCKINVWLTRARCTVAMFTAQGQCSTFLRELEEDGAVVLTNTDGEAVKEAPCPACQQGVLVLRTGPYGGFRSCSNFPACSYKPKRRGMELLPVDQNRIGAQAKQPSVSRSTEPATSDAATPHNASPLSNSAKPPKSFLSTINKALEYLTHNIDRASALQSATAELSRHVHAERTVIEAALESAQQSVELEKYLDAKGPAFRAMFEQSKANLLGVLGEQTSSQEARMERHPLPNFKHVDSHGHPDIQQAIDMKVAGIRDDREVFLSMAHAQLMSNPALLPQVKNMLQRLNGEHYWEALDPDRTLRQRE